MARTAFELDRRIGAVEPLEQSVPGEIEPQILRLVDDARAIHEADDADRTAAIMRIGKVAFDRWRHGLPCAE